MSLTTILSFTVAALAIMTLAARRYMAQRRKAALAMQALPVVEEPSLSDHLAALEHRLAARIEQVEHRHAGLLDAINESVENVRSDIEWLTGEKMIEQAIALARRGEDAEIISAEIGLTLDDARTIVRYRGH